MSIFDFDNFPTKKGPADTTLGRKALWNINDTDGFHTRIVPMHGGGTMRVRTRGGFPEFIVEMPPVVVEQSLGKWVSVGVWFDDIGGGSVSANLATIRLGTDYSQSIQAVYKLTIFVENYTF